MFEQLMADTLSVPASLLVNPALLPEGTIVLVPNEWIIDAICFVLGFVGILIRILSRLVKVNGNESFQILKLYFHDHPLTISLSVLCYLVMIAIWYFQGVDFFGWYAYRLNFSTIFLGYASQDIFNTMFKKKFGDINVEDKPNGSTDTQPIAPTTNNNPTISTIIETPNSQVSQSALQGLHD